MDRPKSEDQVEAPRIVVNPETNHSKTVMPKPSRWPLVVSLLALIAGGGAIGMALWSSAETNREILRMSTELAQLRVSLELYARSQSTAGTAEGGVLSALADRLELLEQAASDATVALPAIAPATQPTTTATGEDCLPPGMRLLVATGDSYGVCGQNANIDVAVVDNGYVSLTDGTTIPSGGSVPLPNSTCTIGVTSSGDEGLTGYAEIRVNC